MYRKFLLVVLLFLLTNAKPTYSAPVSTAQKVQIIITTEALVTVEVIGGTEYWVFDNGYLRLEKPIIRIKETEVPVYVYCAGILKATLYQDAWFGGIAPKGQCKHAIHEVYRDLP